ncbi:hypothetical protein PoB_004623500 [Plakobranchus ocellatus]|uniref:Uncharacterized protein n=1 Tax=Plakobranchus ocellatus TaxID=259542 RepID=A0AAV4BJS5_9GAST|nr:hypothetical protein PoB_004623500 [Plakobranchus ocellatus]
MSKGKQHRKLQGSNPLILPFALLELTVDSKLTLRSAETLLSRVRAPSPAHGLTETFSNIRLSIVSNAEYNKPISSFNQDKTSGESRIEPSFVTAGRNPSQPTPQDDGIRSSRPRPLNVSPIPGRCARSLA